MAATAHAADNPAPDGVLCLLDGFRLHHSGQQVDVPVGGQRVLALLALVGPRSRPVAAGTLWPDVADLRAGGNLRSAVWRLNRIWPGLVACRGHELSLNPLVDVDTVGFVTRLRRIGQGEGPLDLGELDLMLDRIHELLPGWADEWVATERERLRLLNLQALEALSARLLRQGSFSPAMESAMMVVSAEPLRESAHRAVLAVLMAEGNLGAARRHYTQLEEILSRELGVGPSPETGRLLVDSRWSTM